MDHHILKLTLEAGRHLSIARTPHKVIALAGTGKTSTLVLVAKSRSCERILYLAFNRLF